MADELKCSICKKLFTSDEPAVLAVSGYGNARHICEECEALLDTATLGTDTQEIGRAIGRLGAYASDINTSDEVVFDTLGELLRESNERLTKILAGTYDYSEDKSPEDALIDEIPEDMLESEEDKALDEAEAAERAKMDKFISWFSGVVLAGALVYFIVWLILRYV